MNSFQTHETDLSIWYVWGVCACVYEHVCVIPLSIWGLFFGMIILIMMTNKNALYNHVLSFMEQKQVTSLKPSLTH